MVVNPFARPAGFADDRHPDPAGPRQVSDVDPGGRVAASAPASPPQRPHRRTGPRSPTSRPPLTTSRWPTAWRMRCSAGRLDELPPQTRRLLGLLDALVAQRAEADGLTGDRVRFTRRERSRRAGWSDPQVRKSTSTASSTLEYVLVHRGEPGLGVRLRAGCARRRRRRPRRLAGLVDVDALTSTDANFDHPGPEPSTPRRRPRAPFDPPSSPRSTPPRPPPRTARTGRPTARNGHRRTATARKPR